MITSGMSLVAVLLASLVGSPHCAGMCGGFVAFIAGNSTTPFYSHLAYHFGRLLTYTILGFVAGLIGQSLDGWGEVLGFQRLTGILTGVLLLYWGARELLGRKKSATLQTEPKPLLSRITGFYRKALMPDGEVNWLRRAFVLGLLSALLPCGWLYAFVAVAAATADPLYGAVTMSVFWLGTVPILAALGGAVRLFGARLGVLAPRATGILLVVAGLVSLLGHFGYFSSELHGHHLHH